MKLIFQRRLGNNTVCFERCRCDIFYRRNSFFLMDQLRKTRTDGLLKKELVNGKLMIGESAGTIICSPSIQYISEQMDEKPEDYSTRR